MTTKPKTRKAPAKPTAIDKAIARVEAAQAAYEAAPDNSDETTEPLCGAEIDAAYQLADMPCKSDAEFMKKASISMRERGADIWATNGQS